MNINHYRLKLTSVSSSRDVLISQSTVHRWFLRFWGWIREPSGSFRVLMENKKRRTFLVLERERTFNSRDKGGGGEESRWGEAGIFCARERERSENWENNERNATSHIPPSRAIFGRREATFHFPPASSRGILVRGKSWISFSSHTLLR